MSSPSVTSERGGERTFLEKDLHQFAGAVAEPPRVARYAVSAAMIRNWAEALDDRNPVYTDDAAARQSGRSAIIAPPAMISTWIMSGYRRWRDLQFARQQGMVEQTAYSELMFLLDQGGYTSVVATEMEQRFEQEMTVGMHLTCHYTIDSITGPKNTGLGEGYFITLGKRYEDAEQATIATERFTLLRFRPKETA